MKDRKMWVTVFFVLCSALWSCGGASGDALLRFEILNSDFAVRFDTVFSSGGFQHVQSEYDDAVEEFVLRYPGMQVSQQMGQKMALAEQTLLVAVERAAARVARRVVEGEVILMSTRMELAESEATVDEVSMADSSNDSTASPDVATRDSSSRSVNNSIVNHSTRDLTHTVK